MSGGSFNYACFKVEDNEIFGAMSDVRDIENYLRAYQKQDAADEVLIFIKEVETHQRRLVVIGRRISELLRAAEWSASGDSGLDAIDTAYQLLFGPPEKAGMDDLR